MAGFDRLGLRLSVLQENGVAMEFIGKRIGKADDMEDVFQAVVANSAREGYAGEVVGGHHYFDIVHALNGFGDVGEGRGVEIKDVLAPKVGLVDIVGLGYGKGIRLLIVNQLLVGLEGNARLLVGYFHPSFYQRGGYRGVGGIGFYVESGAQGLYTDAIALYDEGFFLVLGYLEIGFSAQFYDSILEVIGSIISKVTVGIEPNLGAIGQGEPCFLPFLNRVFHHFGHPIGHGLMGTIGVSGQSKGHYKQSYGRYLVVIGASGAAFGCGLVYRREDIGEHGGLHRVVGGSGSIDPKGMTHIVEAFTFVGPGEPFVELYRLLGRQLAVK